MSLLLPVFFMTQLPPSVSRICYYILLFNSNHIYSCNELKTIRFYDTLSIEDQMKLSLMILFFAVIFFLSGIAPASADFRETKKVLVLYSLEKGNVGQERVDAQLKSIFSGNKNLQIVIYNEYLDLIRFPGSKQIANLNHFLNQKYSSEKPDVIITVLPVALDFLEQYGKKLFERVPIVAALLPRDRAESLAGSPLRKRGTGTIYADNAYEIAESALMLIPGTKHIAFVAGSSPLDISFKVPILRETRHAAEGLEVIDLAGLSMKEILSRVHNLPTHTIVFHTSIFRDADGVVFNPPDAHRMVSDASNAPVFGFVESHMGKGIVGGRLALLEWHIGKIAELTQRILAGESPASIPILSEEGYRFVYDDRELRRWKIPESRLPRGSILINKEPNVFERYKAYIIAAMILTGVQTFFIGFLIRLNRKQKQTSMQLREYEERYKELLRVDRTARLGELTASLAHELNQPLTAILSTAQAALRFLGSGNNDPALHREILQNIVHDDKRAADIIRSLRSMVKREDSIKEKVNVVEALSEVVAITHGELIKHNVQVETLLDASLPPVLANKGQIQQVLLNLILNALDSLEQIDPDKRTIILQTNKSDGFVRVAVNDNGKGIPQENSERVFDPFYTSKDTGLGMGLSVCKTIITSHKGRIWAEKNPAGGATISFELPVADHA
jgi:signal transduction histidine kinase